jgi:uncharacterized protein YdbL (DUF1318 family)
MGNLFSALNSASQSLQAFEQAIDVTQNNVTNANSPGYADQVPQLISQDFSPTPASTAGGVQEVTQDTRSTYADTAVQQQLSLQGMYQQLQTTLTPLQNVFDVSSSSAIPSALNQLFQSFSHGAHSPATRTTKSAVIDAAQQTASAFQQAAVQLGQIQTSTTNDIQSTVTQINQDAAAIQSYNQQIAQNSAAQRRIERAVGKHARESFRPGEHPGVAGQSAARSPCCSAARRRWWKAPGERHSSRERYRFHSWKSRRRPYHQHRGQQRQRHHQPDHLGQPGRTAERSNTLLPSLIGGGQQVGGLNTLAQGLADSVNTVLEQASTTTRRPIRPAARCSPIMQLRPRASPAVPGR